jgi:hypothetical protein
MGKYFYNLKRLKKVSVSEKENRLDAGGSRL